jgi:hypothetical protein
VRKRKEEFRIQKGRGKKREEKIEQKIAKEGNNFRF